MKNGIFYEKSRKLPSVLYCSLGGLACFRVLPGSRMVGSSPQSHDAQALPVLDVFLAIGKGSDENRVGGKWGYAHFMNIPHDDLVSGCEWFKHMYIIA